MNTEESNNLFIRANKLIPGGVNSPVRAFTSVPGIPPYIVKGEGCSLLDVDGNEYIDYCSSWGPLILGHADKDVLDAVKGTASSGLSFGACNPLEVEMAELLDGIIDYDYKYRMVNSGTEAVMTALRLARGYTGKDYIIKFDGCYHGHSDSLLVSSGSGLLTNTTASSSGVTEKTTSEVISVSYGNKDEVEMVFEKYKGNIAGIIIEPLAGNMGLIKPLDTFLQYLREITKVNNSLLIFDEVITGFRFKSGLYSDLVGIEPDITTLGKILGGGMPIGAIAGKQEIMDCLAPVGRVYQAGTLSGNPVALAGGIAGIKKLIETQPYKRMESLAEMFASSINTFAKASGVPVICVSYGSVFTLFFREQKPNCLEEVKQCDTVAFGKYHEYMLENGFYLPPSQFELNFISSVHTKDHIEEASKKAIVFLKNYYKK